MSTIKKTENNFTQRARKSAEYACLPPAPSLRGRCGGECNESLCGGLVSGADAVERMSKRNAIIEFAGRIAARRRPLAVAGDEIRQGSSC